MNADTEQLLDCIPFAIRAPSLPKLLLEFARPLSRHTNDNALAESEKGSSFINLFSYAHIAQRWALLINTFNHSIQISCSYQLSCFFPKIITAPKGKDKKMCHYEGMMIPCDKLRSIDNAINHLKPGITFLILDKVAHSQNDDHAAKDLVADNFRILFPLPPGEG